MRGLVYISKASSPFEEPELQSLIKTSSENNSKNNITGYISYDPKQSMFIQYIEGNDKDINALFDKIYKDYRHKITHFVGKETNNRRFPSWDMRLLEEHDFKEIHDIMICHLFHLDTSPNLMDYKNKLIWNAVDSIADNKV